MSDIENEATSSATGIKGNNNIDVTVQSDDNISETDRNTSGVDACGHPWPYLQSMFKVKCIQSKTIHFLCLMCTPKVCELSAYTNL